VAAWDTRSGYMVSTTAHYTSTSTPRISTPLILILIPPELRNVTSTLPRLGPYSSNLNPSHLFWTTSSLATPAGGWRDG
jgi:hypothetical protein